MPTDTLNETGTTDRIEEALEILNRTAREKKEDLLRMLDERYTDMRALLSEMAVSNRELLSQMRDAARERVRERPFAVVGGAAAFALLAGYLFGCSHSRRF